MSFDTYANLQLEIAGWLNRADLTSQIPSFIALAEAQMNQKLRVPRMLATATPSITADTISAPTDLLMVKAFRLTSGSGRELLPTTEEQAQAYKATPSQVPSEPRTYVVRSTPKVFEFTPTPDQTYSSALVYYQKIPALSVSNTSNWVLADFPHVYLYGALVQAAPYMKRDDRVQMWAEFFTEALDDARGENHQAYTQALAMDAGLQGRSGFNIRSGDHG